MRGGRRWGLGPHVGERGMKRDVPSVVEEGGNPRDTALRRNEEDEGRELKIAHARVKKQKRNMDDKVNKGF